MNSISYEQMLKKKKGRSILLRKKKKKVKKSITKGSLPLSASETLTINVFAG